MSLKNISPRLILAIVSFPGFAFHAYFVGVMLYDGGPNPSGTIIGYIFKAFSVMLVIDIMLVGMPLISLFVMVGVAISFMRREQVLIRWTPVSISALVWTVLSYVLGAYVNYNLSLP